MLFTDGGAGTGGTGRAVADSLRSIGEAALSSVDGRASTKAAAEDGSTGGAEADGSRAAAEDGPTGGGAAED